MYAASNSRNVFDTTGKTWSQRQGEVHGFRVGDDVSSLFERLTDALNRRGGFVCKLQYTRRNSITESVDSFEWGESILHHNVEWQIHSVPPLHVFLNSEDVYRAVVVQRLRIYGGDSWYYSWLFINCSSNPELQDDTEYVRFINQIHHSNVRCIPIYDHVQDAAATQADLFAPNPSPYYNELFRRDEPTCAITIMYRHFGINLEPLLLDCQANDLTPLDQRSTNSIGLMIKDAMCATHSLQMNEVCAMVNCIHELTNIASLHVALLGLDDRLAVTLPYKIASPFSLRVVLCACVHACLRPSRYKLHDWQRSDAALSSMICDLQMMLQHSTTNFCTIPDQNNALEKFLYDIVHSQQAVAERTTKRKCKKGNSEHTQAEITLNKMANTGEQLVAMCFRHHQRHFDATAQHSKCTSYSQTTARDSNNIIGNDLPANLLDQFTCKKVCELQISGYAPQNLSTSNLWPFNSLFKRENIHRLFSNKLMGMSNVYFNPSICREHKQNKRIIEDTKLILKNMVRDKFSHIHDIGKCEQVRLVVLNPKDTLKCLECSKRIPFAEMTLPPMHQQCINCQGQSCLACIEDICGRDSYYICKKCQCQDYDPACYL